MRRKKSGIILSFFLLMTLIFAGIDCMQVEAGLSDIVIDKDTYTEELDNSVWNNPDDDILIEKDTLVFENTSSEYTRLITKTAVQATDEMEELVNVQATLQFTDLPEGKMFALAFGVQKIEAMQGDPGNVELVFTNNDALEAALIYYNEDGDALILGEAASCGGLNAKITVEAVITTKQELSVTIGGKKIWTVEIPVSGEGRIGFVQTGACGVRLSDVKILSHLYDSPENCDIYEDFEAGGFNANLLTSKMQNASYVCWPSGTGIKELGDSQVFRYTNAGECYIGTKYAYSNFELSFDVPYLQRKNVMAEDGSIEVSASNRFGISYGGEAVDYDYAGYEDAVADVIWFQKNSAITSEGTKETVDAAALGYPFFSAECDKGFSIKVTMYDSVVTVYMKWLDEVGYTKMLEYQLSTITPTGYLHIWTNGPTNMAIDNIKIVNKDLNPQLAEVDFKTSTILGPEDYEYQPMEKIYATTTDEEEGFDWYLVLPVVLAVCVIGLGTVAGIAVVKKKKKGE